MDSFFPNLEGAARTGGSLFKNQSDVFSFEKTVRHAGALLRLQLGRQIQKARYFFRRQIQQLQKLSVFKLKHFSSSRRDNKTIIKKRTDPVNRKN